MKNRMTDEEKLLLRRRWQFTNEFKMFGKGGIFKLQGFDVLDLRKDGVLILKDNPAELQYLVNDRFLEISAPLNPKNVLRLRIGDLTSDKLTVGISGKKGDEADGKFRSEFVELIYRPIDE